MPERDGWGEWRQYNNNNNGHFSGTWSLARSRAQCAVQKAAEKCINTYNGRNKKGFGPHDRQTRKNLHTAISVNKPKYEVEHRATLLHKDQWQERQMLVSMW